MGEVGVMQWGGTFAGTLTEGKFDQTFENHSLCPQSNVFYLFVFLAMDQEEWYVNLKPSLSKFCLGLV